MVYDKMQRLDTSNPTQVEILKMLDIALLCIDCMISLQLLLLVTADIHINIQDILPLKMTTLNSAR